MPTRAWDGAQKRVHIARVAWSRRCPFLAVATVLVHSRADNGVMVIAAATAQGVCVVVVIVHNRPARRPGRRQRREEGPAAAEGHVVEGGGRLRAQRHFWLRGGAVRTVSPPAKP